MRLGRTGTHIPTVAVGGCCFGQGTRGVEDTMTTKTGLAWALAFVCFAGACGESSAESDGGIVLTGDDSSRDSLDPDGGELGSTGRDSGEDVMMYSPCAQNAPLPQSIPLFPRAPVPSVGAASLRIWRVRLP